MARKPKNKPAKRTFLSEPRQARSRPGWALIVFLLAALVAVAVFDYNSAQFNATNPADPNLVGYVGSHIGFYGFHFLGVAVFFLPFYMLWFCVRLLLQQRRRRRVVTAVLSLFSLLCAAGLAAMLAGPSQVKGSVFDAQLSNGFGGLLGQWLAPGLLAPFVGSFGTFLLLSSGLLLFSLLAFTNNFTPLLCWFKARYQVFQKAQLAAAERRKKMQVESAAARQVARQSKLDAAAVSNLEAAASNQRIESEELEEFSVDKDGRMPSLLRSRPSAPPSLKFAAPARTRASKKTKLASLPSTLVQSNTSEDESPPDASINDLKKPKLDASTIKIISGEKTEKSVASIPERRGDYVFPPLELLSEAPDYANQAPEDHASTMQALVRTLEEFSVKVIPGEIHTGPVITRYEVKPAPGVRVEKIVNLDKNIALGLKALSVRILAPVPGKGTVGIEVPNRIAQAVCMRDIIESRAWAEADAEIPVVLGKDVTGKPMVTDLTKMPHVLIAGSTGAGKTVCINAIIASLLYHSGPEDLRFIMVDPKVVEMQMYNALPHMLIPVVTEAKKVPGALKWLIAEMEHRYQIFAKTNVRNIAGFNAKIAKDKVEQAKADAMDAAMTPEERAAVSQIGVPRDDDAFEIPKKKLPYIVCVIDELADLMMVAPADIETCIARIAQLARAAGIHLILATQRPSVNVITGVIKANLPSRISFKVASKIDSRTILDGGGAEALIGKGDMLFIPPGTSSLVRAQGAFVSDEEINAIVEFLKEKNEPPQFAQEVQRLVDAGDDEAPTAGTGESDDDELLPAAIDVLRSTKRASTSMLQRRLRVGYNRAARLMEELEARGVVGPENGSSPREILVDLDAM
jgi:DNA segregation ATPase FtsK/SpoIIIE, S-DNA-T family